MSAPSFLPNHSLALVFSLPSYLPSAPRHHAVIWAYPWETSTCPAHSELPSYRPEEQLLFKAQQRIHQATETASVPWFSFLAFSCLYHYTETLKSVTGVGELGAGKGIKSSCILLQMHKLLYTAGRARGTSRLSQVHMKQQSQA